jgi:hypothetical protein
MAGEIVVNPGEIAAKEGSSRGSCPSHDDVMQWQQGGAETEKPRRFRRGLPRDNAFDQNL